MTAMPAELPWWQRIPFGTTAWRLSMGRRQVVESVNAALKGTFADLSRGFFRVFGQTKMTILLGFTVAGYNLDRIRSYRAKKRAQEEAKPAQPKRRRGTWRDVVDETAIGRDDRDATRHIATSDLDLTRLPHGGRLQRVPKPPWQSESATEKRKTAPWGRSFR